MDLSDDDVEQIAGADRRVVDPPIQVDAATWSKAGRLNWFVHRGQLGRDNVKLDPRTSCRCQTAKVFGGTMGHVVCVKDMRCGRCVVASSAAPCGQDLGESTDA